VKYNSVVHNECLARSHKSNVCASCSSTHVETIIQFLPDSIHCSGVARLTASFILAFSSSRLTTFLNRYSPSHMSRGSSVIIASDYGLDDRGFIPCRGKMIFPVACVQIGSGAYPASYPMGTGGVPFPGGISRTGRDADHSPHLVPPLPRSVFMACSGTALPNSSSHNPESKIPVALGRKT
jgi:hypothetical protein